MRIGAFKKGDFGTKETQDKAYRMARGLAGLLSLGWKERGSQSEV